MQNDHVAYKLTVMINNYAKRSYSKFVIPFTIIICASESWAKGWTSFVLVPASIVVILPLYAFISYRSVKQDTGSYVRWIRPMSILLSISLLTTYVCLPGYGDSDEALVFGFYTSNRGSILTSLSTMASVLGMILVLVAFVALLVLLALNERQVKSTTTTNPPSADQPTA